MSTQNCGCTPESIGLNTETNTVNSDCPCDDNSGLVTKETVPDAAPQMPGNCCVISVNNKNGIVALNTDDIPEGDLNLYFTAQRARGTISGQEPIAYDGRSGVIKHLDSGIAPGIYGNSKLVNITVDEKGHIMRIQEVDIPTNGVDPEVFASLVGPKTATGYITKIGHNQWAFRSIRGSNGRVRVTESKGTTGDTVIDLEPIRGLRPTVYGASNQIPVLQIDGYGRVTGASTVPVVMPEILASGYIKELYIASSDTITYELEQGWMLMKAIIISPDADITVSAMEEGGVSGDLQPERLLEAGKAAVWSTIDFFAYGTNRTLIVEGLVPDVQIYFIRIKII